MFSQDEIERVLTAFNPWWTGTGREATPVWKRDAFTTLRKRVLNPPDRRATMLSGARQVGKTTMIRQVIGDLLREGVSPAKVLYASFDTPIFRQAGPDAVLRAWRDRAGDADGTEHIFLDELQFVPHWGTWLKHQVDFWNGGRIVFTGSALPLAEAGTESGAGRWHQIRIDPLSFAEYLGFRGVSPPALPRSIPLAEMFDWQRREFFRAAEATQPYVRHFSEYLLRGGYPGSASAESIRDAQDLMRDDIIEKVLKRDMSDFFGVRRLPDLEAVFHYICGHTGGMLNTQALSKCLGVTRPTLERFLRLLEAAHLIRLLRPHGYGKEVLRGRVKAYPANPAFAPAILYRGEELLDNPGELGPIAEGVVHSHLFAGSRDRGSRLSYWRDSRGHEVDFIVEEQGETLPLEVKYRSGRPAARDLKGLRILCEKKGLRRAAVVTKSAEEFGLIPPEDAGFPSGTQILKIPAPALCLLTPSERADAAG